MDRATTRRQLIHGGVLLGGAALGASAIGTALSGNAEVAGAAATTAKKTTTTKFKPTQIGTIKVARISLNKPLYAGVDDATLKFGPGHAMWTVDPGEAGHCLIMGHRTSGTAPFKRLNNMKAGDPVITGGLTYRVVKWEVLPATNPHAIWDYPGSGPRLTLVACSQPNGQPTSTAYRICVRCQA